MLVKNAGIRGRYKLADWWEKDPYIVIDQPNDDIPDYRVKRDVARSKTRILHRNFLLPLHWSSDLWGKWASAVSCFSRNSWRSQWVRWNTIYRWSQIRTRRQPMMKAFLATVIPLYLRRSGCVGFQCGKSLENQVFCLLLYSLTLTQISNQWSFLLQVKTTETRAQLGPEGNLTECDLMVGFLASCPRTYTSMDRSHWSVEVLF